MINAKLISIIFVFFAGNLWSGEIRGKLSFQDGAPAIGEVCVGKIHDPQSAYLSAMMDVLSTQRGVRTDPAGNFVIQNVPDGVACMLIADIDAQSSPSRTMQITLQAGEIKQGVDLVFPKIVRSAVNLKGKVAINGVPPSEDIAGTVTLIRSDSAFGSLVYFGKTKDGAYEFENVPAGTYTLSAGVPTSPTGNTAKRVSASVVIGATGISTVNINIQIP